MNAQERAGLDRLREAFSSEDWERSTEDCPAPNELWASAAGELEPAEDEAVFLHLARCSQCASIWRLAREMITPNEETSAPVVCLEDRKRKRLWQRPVLLAAAAMVVIGVGLGTVLLHRRAPAPQVYRQQRTEAVVTAAPGTGRLPRAACRLRWNAGPPGTRYDLVVSDPDLTLLGSAKGLSEPEYLVLEKKIPPSVGKILWRVTAHLPDGRTLSSKTFTTEIER